MEGGRTKSARRKEKKPAYEPVVKGTDKKRKGGQKTKKTFKEQGDKEREV